MNTSIRQCNLYVTLCNLYVTYTILGHTSSFYTHILYPHLPLVTCNPYFQNIYSIGPPKHKWLQTSYPLTVRGP